jgi:Kef-type K+ transport system membrane component KefB
MSAAAHAKKGIAARLAEAAVLAALFALMYGVTRLFPGIHGGIGTIAAVGFLLLAGTLTCSLLEPFGLPHLTGYLLAGVVAGPHLLSLVDHQAVVDLTPVNGLALSLIALAGGAELRLPMLRQNLRSLSWATLVQNSLGLALVTAVFVAARPLVAFARDLPTAALVGVALLWGVLALTRSPSAVMGVLAQTRASGPLTNFTVGFVMTSDVVVVVVLALVLTLVRPLLEPGAVLSAAAFGAVGHELLGSISVGTTLGLVLVAYLRFVGKALVLVFIAFGLVLTEVIAYLRFDWLLVFLVAGFVVQNLSRQGEKLLHAIEGTGEVVYVIFFATAGAHLDVPLLRELWPVALLFFVARALVTALSARLSGRLSDDPPLLRRWGWAGLLSQAGITLGIAASIAREFPSFGPGFGALALASVGLAELVGPILFKVALERAGEARGGEAAAADPGAAG